MREAKLVVRVTMNGETFEKAVDVGSPFVEGFEPIDVCDSASLAFVLSAHTEATARVVRKRREYYADYLADVIARALVELMKSRDTRNGYPKEKD